MTVLLRRSTLPLILLACLASGPAYANCTNPAGVERDLIYNGDYHTYQFCDGTNWIVAGGTVALESFVTQTIGETTVLGTDDSGNGNLLLAQRTALSYASTIQSLSFYVNTAAGNLRLGIYDASGPGGGPGAKKAETNGFTPTTGWNTANVVTPVVLPAGTYWLAYLPDDSGLHFAVDAASGTTDYYSFTYGTMPATFSTTPTTGTAHWSFYATLTPSCISPAGNERDIIYNTDSHALQFCNGASWLSMGQGSGGGGGGCSSPAGKERDIIYSSDYHTYQFCNGTNWVKYGGSARYNCASPATPGSLCVDGTIYAGLSTDGDVPMYTTPADAPGTYTWNKGVSASLDTAVVDCDGDTAPISNFTGTGCDTGQSNTAVLAGLSDSSSPYVAAAYCDSLNAYGHTDWYLPALKELAVLSTNEAAIGGFDTGANYWSSSESSFHDQANNTASLGSGQFFRTDKSEADNVRCVRR